MIKLRGLLTEDKYSDFWDKLYKVLDKAISSYDAKKVSDFNKVVKILKQLIPNISSMMAGKVANEYANYRSGSKTIEQSKKDMIAMMDAHKMK